MTAQAKILVVDDSADIVEIMADLLEANGYAVCTAGSGPEALAQIEREQPDLLLLDVMMPDMTGYEVCRKIRENPATVFLPVVMLTAFSQRDLVDRASQAGAMAYVVKPFNKADLIPAIEIARARFAEIQAVEAEVGDLTERLESRKAVERAKGLLQSGLGLSEPEAFRWIQKTAMDLRKSMREVAEGVIEHGSTAKKK